MCELYLVFDIGMCQYTITVLYLFIIGHSTGKSLFIFVREVLLRGISLPILQLNIVFERNGISMKEIHQIYDKAFKRILTLSEKTVINLINGLFDTDYPTDSKITYNWTEHEDKELKRTLADSILTINGRDSYHIEAQMTEDEEIVFRFIEYGFGHAFKNYIQL